MLEKISILQSMEDLYCLVSKQQLGISEVTAESRGEQRMCEGQRMCEEKGEAEKNYSVLTLNPTFYIPLKHLVFSSAGLMISLRKEEAKGFFYGFSLCFPPGK